MKLLNRSDIIDYEIRSSWWASWISWDPLQTLAGHYFAWKVKRKYTRYKNCMDEGDRVRQVQKDSFGGL